MIGGTFSSILVTVVQLECVSYFYIINNCQVTTISILIMNDLLIVLTVLTHNNPHNLSLFISLGYNIMLNK